LSGSPGTHPAGKHVEGAGLSANRIQHRTLHANLGDHDIAPNAFAQRARGVNLGVQPCALQMIALQRPDTGHGSMVGSTENDRNRPLRKACENRVGPGEPMRMGNHTADVVERDATYLLPISRYGKEATMNGHMQAI
jgi:hypothetical protein